VSLTKRCVGDTHSKLARFVRRTTGPRGSDRVSSIVGRPDFEPLAIAFKRVVNIVSKQGGDASNGPVRLDALQDRAEKELHTRTVAVQASVAKLLARDDYAGALREITGLKPAVDLFFDEVLVMAEDLAVRQNRIRLLAMISALFSGLADFSRIHGAGVEAPLLPSG
jgi:glycyl-tRNA synthetase beta chain